MDLADPSAAALLAAEAFERTGIEYALYGGLLLDRIALLGGAGHAGINTIDLVRPRNPRYRKAAVGRSVLGPLRRRRIRVLAPEDFVVFKVLSSRERDIDDAASVVRALGGRLDLDLVRKTVAGLARSSRGLGLAGRLREVVARGRGAGPPARKRQRR